MLGIRNPLENPLFWPTIRNVALLFGLGLGLVLFFARKNLKAGLTGELGQRYVSWLLITPIFLAAIFVRGIVASVLLLLFFFQITREYASVVGLERRYRLALYLFMPVTFLVATHWPALYFFLPAVFILFLTLLPILVTGRVEEATSQYLLTERGYLYLIWFSGHLVLLRQLGEMPLVMVVGIGVALSDVMQYTVGNLIGTHIISPNVNPRKAWEGMIGAVLGAGIAVFLFPFALPEQFTLLHRLLFVLIIGIGASWGDLISSLLKRASEVKDWGQLIPGHGGLLDRTNSLVPVAPLAYYFTFLVLRFWSQ